MRYFLPFFLAGIILALYIFQPKGGPECNAGYFIPLSSLEDKSEAIDLKYKVSEDDVNYQIEDRIYRFNRDGSLVNVIKKPGLNSSLSKSGLYFVSFEKVGKEIEFYNYKKERFWKKESREYPYLSYNSRLILLLDGDQSRIRIVNDNGAETGVKSIEGRFCTAINFSPRNDCGAVGFADGTYYFLDRSGNILYNGRTLKGTIVKGIAVSSNGSYGAVHFGDVNKDSILLVDIKKKETEVYNLKTHHIMKTAVYVTDDGLTLFGDFTALRAVKNSGKELFTVHIPQRKAGFMSISSHGPFFSAGFTTKGGVAAFIIFDRDGDVLKYKMFSADSYMETQGSGNVIHLRGSRNLYSYNLEY